VGPIWVVKKFFRKFKSTDDTASSSNHP
jgi:hypothetical protein